VAYTLTKAALITLTQVLAVALAPRIQVNCLALGAILLPAGADEAYRDRLLAQIPARRLGGPADVVRALLFLLESDYVTGEVVLVDGGRHLV
jgi:NAD(P)-dependent dehydrogenase (short-subunit alcohol dehydrogenase family)